MVRNVHGPFHSIRYGNILTGILVRAPRRNCPYELKKATLSPVRKHGYLRIDRIIQVCYLQNRPRKHVSLLIIRKKSLSMLWSLNFIRIDAFVLEY